MTVQVQDITAEAPVAAQAFVAKAVLEQGTDWIEPYYRPEREENVCEPALEALEQMFAYYGG